VSVYVDSLTAVCLDFYKDRQAVRVGGRNNHRWAHMMADTDDELHAMAARIGLKREWFQGDHYDLTPSRHKRAVAAGAKVVRTRDLVRIRVERRSR
jgi:hypothetical protein